MKPPEISMPHLVYKLESELNVTRGWEALTEKTSTIDWLKRSLETDLMYGNHSDTEKIFVYFSEQVSYLPPRCRKLRTKFVETLFETLTFADLRETRLGAVVLGPSDEKEN